MYIANWFRQPVRRSICVMEWSEAEAEKLVEADKASFRPYYAMSYMYEELLALDAGSWFNETSIRGYMKSFSEQHQYISALEAKSVTLKEKC